MLEMKAMFKLFNDDSEWKVFQNVINLPHLLYAKSKNEKEVFEKIRSVNWEDNTEGRPDFISDEIMIEMFEIDDIVTTKKGKKNPQREADARALRTVQNLKLDLNENARIAALGDTRFDPKTESYTPDRTEDHHNY